MIEDKVVSMTGRGLEQFGFPALNREDDLNLDREMLRETCYNEQEMQEMIETREPNLTPDQRVALDKIMDLSFGKILLALSSPTQLEAMLAQEMPYIVPYSQVIKECLQESKCEKMAELIETTGLNMF